MSDPPSIIVAFTEITGVRFDLELDVENNTGPFEPVSDVSFQSESHILEVEKQPIADSELRLRITLRARLERETGVRAMRLSALVPVAGVTRVLAYPFVNDPDFAWEHRQEVAANQGVPFLLSCNAEGDNLFFFGCLDLRRDYVVSLQKWNYPHYRSTSEVMEHAVHSIATPISGGCIKGDVFEWSIYVSTKRRHWFRQLTCYREHVDRHHHIRDPAIPDSAYRPVWCSWYAHLCNPTEAAVTENARVAADIGFGVMILDGGWFTPFDVADAVTPNASSWAGDWEANEGKFPDLPGALRKIKDMGLAPVMWIAPLRHGRRSKRYESVKHLKVRLRDAEEKEMCPRCMETAREARVVVTELVRRFSLDGVKIDFLDVPRCVACTGDHRHDFFSLSGGILECMKQMHQGLAAMNPDLWIEYRQFYATPLTRQYATCFRAIDSPHDYLRIRRLVTMLKPFAGKVPIHADPVYWHPDESLENIARMCSSAVLGCVPQISVRLTELPRAALRILKAWLRFYNQNRDFLLAGDYLPLSMDAQYANFRISQAGRVLFGVYSKDWPAALDCVERDVTQLWLVNGSTRDDPCSRIAPMHGRFVCEILDAAHRLIASEEIVIDRMFQLEHNVPCGGMLSLCRIG